MSKEFKYGAEARASSLLGIEKLAKAVRSTLGPKGRNVVIERAFAPPLITKDGATVAKHIYLEDPVENVACSLVKDVASKTAEDAGDGTTTATVLAHAIFTEGNKALAAGYNAVDLKRGIDKAVVAAVGALKDMSVPCSDNKSITNVGSISANSDTKVGELIADAMLRVGTAGVITVESGTGLEDELDVVEGMQFDRGFLSPYFINTESSMTCELDQPFILMVDKKVSNIRELIPALELVSKTGAPLLIIAEDIEGEALATIVLNTVKGIVKVCAIRSPGFGHKGNEMLTDIAVLTNGTVISKRIDRNLSTVTIEDLGQAKKVIISKDKTIIIDGQGSNDDVKARIESIRNFAGRAKDGEPLTQVDQERIAKLSGGVAVIKVGATTEVEMKEKKGRVEDALHATRAAVEEGIVPGGGVALVRAIAAVQALETSNREQEIGKQIIIKAMEAPLRQIVLNAGGEPSVILNNVSASDIDNYGFNAASDSYGNMIEMGIIDPTKVVRSALQNAASVAGLMITTDCVITQKKIEEDNE